MSNVGTNHHHHRRSIRLKEYDYSQCGYYFVTICTRNRECVLGNIMDDKIILNGLGIIVKQCWDDLIIHFTNMGLDEYVVMPNHFHGIIIIENNALQCRGVPWRAPTNKMSQITPPSGSLGVIINHFKSAVKRWCNKNGYEHFNWQRNYYEHIIRNESELNRIREYIINNPLQWEFDKNNPINTRRNQKEKLGFN